VDRDDFTPNFTFSTLKAINKLHSPLFNVLFHCKTSLLFDNVVWLDEVFLPTHQKRLREAAFKARNTLISLGVKVRPAQAGFFLWADFRHFLPTVNHDEELGKSCNFQLTLLNVVICY
jgi:hypothetical protein